MNGRSFACLRRISVAWTSAWASASSGRWRSPVTIRSSIGQPSATRRSTDSGGSTGATTILGSSRSGGPARRRRPRARPTASAISLRRVAARPGCGGGRPPAPPRSGHTRRSAPTRVSALAAASRAIMSRPAASWRSKYASDTPSRASLVAACDPRLPGLDDLPRGQRSEDARRRTAGSMVSPDTCAGPPAGIGPETLEPAAAVAPEEQRTLADRLDPALDRLGLAVVADPVRPEVEARQPEDARLLQLGQGLADPLPRDGDVQVAGTRPGGGRRPGRSAGSPGRGPAASLRARPRAAGWPGRRSGIGERWGQSQRSRRRQVARAARQGRRGWARVRPRCGGLRETRCGAWAEPPDADRPQDEEADRRTETVTTTALSGRARHFDPLVPGGTDAALRRGRSHPRRSDSFGPRPRIVNIIVRYYGLHQRHCRVGGASSRTIGATVKV